MARRMPPGCVTGAQRKSRASNIQHRTSNFERQVEFDVGRSMLAVQCSKKTTIHWTARGEVVILCSRSRQTAGRDARILANSATARGACLLLSVLGHFPLGRLLGVDQAVAIQVELVEHFARAEEFVPRQV